MPSRLEVLTRLRAEKAEAAALREDPLGTAVDAQQESLVRLQALRQQQQQQPAQAAAAASDDAQQDSRAAPEEAAAAGATGDAAADGSADGASSAAAGAGDAGDGQAVGDPYANMTPKQRKLHELKQKLQQARKANENAIIAERKRQRVSYRPCSQQAHCGPVVAGSSCMGLLCYLQLGG